MIASIYINSKNNPTIYTIIKDNKKLVYVLTTNYDKVWEKYITKVLEKNTIELHVKINYIKKHYKHLQDINSENLNKTINEVINIYENYIK